MDNDVDIALLILRIVFGVSLAMHGAQKLFGWWNGPGLAGFEGWLASLGVRAPKAAALMAACSEFFGGLLFALGLVTPLAAFLMIVVMVTAIGMVHWKAGFFSSDGGYEYNLAIITAAVAVAMAGPGEHSLDAALDVATDWTGVEWGVGVLIAGLLVGGFNVASRRGTTPEGGAPPDPTAA